MYNTFIRGTKRQLKQESGISLDRAIAFLTTTPHGVVSDGRTYFTLEELKNVKSIRSFPGTGKNSSFTSGIKIHEDTSRELPKVVGDNPEPSTARDNQWDQ